MAKEPEIVPAEHYEEDPEHGWKGSDLSDDDLSDDDYAQQFAVVQQKEVPSDVGESDPS